MKRQAFFRRFFGAAIVGVLTILIVCLVHDTPQPLIDVTDPLSAKPIPTTLYFLDVGQGDSTLIVSGSDAILVDGGPRDAGETVVQDLHDLGIEHLTAIIATHPHQDHIGGLVAVLREFPVDTLYLSDAVLDTKTFRRFFRAAVNSDAELKFPDLGSRIEMDGGAVLTTIAPGAHAQRIYGIGSENLNPCSLVFRLDVHGHSVLLTGDTTKQSERDMIKRGEPLQCDVLKVAHHGDNSSTSVDFLAAARPTYGVISYSADNPYGVPDPVVLQRLQDFDVTLFTTASNGIVTLTITPDSLLFE